MKQIFINRLFYLTMLFYGFLPSAFSQEQELYLEEFNQKHGLPQGYVTAIVQDKTGFIWVATKVGLSRYDGYTFKNYQHNPKDSNSISSNFIRSMVVDEQNRLWILTSEGKVDIIILKNFEIIHLSLSQIAQFEFGYFLQRKTFGAPVIRINSNLYLCHLNPQSKQVNYSQIPCSIPFTPDDIYLYKPKITANNELLLRIKTPSGDEFRLYHLITKTNTLLYKSNEKVGVISHYLQSKNAVYFTNKSEHFIYLIYEKKLIPLPISKFAYCYHIDNKDQLWFHEEQALFILKIKNGKIEKLPLKLNTTFEVKTNFQHNISSFEDNAGNIFIGTQGYGIIKFYSINFPFKKFSWTKYPSVPYIKAINNFPILFANKGYYQYNIYNKKEEFFKLKNFITDANGNSTNFYNAIFKNNEFILFYPNGEILTINTKTYRINSTFKTDPIDGYVEDNIALSNNYFCIFYVKNNYLFMRYFDEKFTLIKDLKLSQNQVSSNLYNVHNAILVENKNLFIASKIGLIKIDIDNWKIENISEKNHISSSNIISIQYSQQLKKLWIGTEGDGLIQYDINSNKYSLFTKAQGLPDNVIYGILENENTLWLSTNNGLSQFDFLHNTFFNYKQEDGLQNNEFNRKCCIKLNDSLFAFGGVKGVNYFNPYLFKNNVINTTIDFSSCKINNIEFLFNSRLKSANNQYHLKLSHTENNIELDFVIFDFLEPSRNIFKYRIANSQNNDWIFLENSHKLNFSALKSGKYIIEILGASSRGTWAKTPLTLVLEIANPWYKTWWAILLYFFAITCVLYLVFNYRIKQVKKLFQLRSQISSDLHDDVGSSISSINIYNELLRTQLEKNSPESLPILQKNNEIIQEIMENLSDIVWAINPKNDKTENIFTRINQQILPLLYDANYAVDIDIAEQTKKINLNIAQRKNLYLCIKEIINNSLKYSQGNIIHFSSQKSNNNLIITISDNGIGFDSNKFTKGNGIQNIKNRMTEIKGFTEIMSASGKGCSIKLILPIAEIGY